MALSLICWHSKVLTLLDGQISTRILRRIQELHENTPRRRLERISTWWYRGRRRERRDIPEPRSASNTLPSNGRKSFSKPPRGVPVHRQPSHLSSFKQSGISDLILNKFHRFLGNYINNVIQCTYSNHSSLWFGLSQQLPNGVKMGPITIPWRRWMRKPPDP